MSSLSSQESEALTLDSSGPDSAPSHSLSETSPVSIGSGSTGPESRSTGMSIPSQGSLFEDRWILSAEASPASPSASPGSRKGQKTSGTSGPRCHESSEKSDPVGYSLRTYLACELSRLTSCLKTWKDRGTPAGRSWWVLMTSEGRTGENAFGSLQDWGTPRVTTNGGRGNGARTKGSRLEDQACWPTPHGMQVDNPRMAGPAGNELGRAVTKDWATPAARDWKDSGPTQGNRKSPNLGTQCAGLLAPESPSTLGKPQDWPTPNAADAIGGKGPRIGMSPTGQMPDGSKATVNLRAAIVLKDAEFLHRFAMSIRDEIQATEWPTPRANRHGAPDSHGKTPIRGSLNPRWVAQLMGFPTDWLDSPPPIAAKPSRRSATQYAQSTPTTLEKQS